MKSFSIVKTLAAAWFISCLFAVAVLTLISFKVEGFMQHMPEKMPAPEPTEAFSK